MRSHERIPAHHGDQGGDRRLHERQATMLQANEETMAFGFGASVPGSDPRKEGAGSASGRGTPKGEMSNKPGGANPRATANAAPPWAPARPCTRRSAGRRRRTRHSTACSSDRKPSGRRHPPRSPARRRTSDTARATPNSHTRTGDRIRVLDSRAQHRSRPGSGQGAAASDFRLPASDFGRPHGQRAAYISRLSPAQGARPASPNDLNLSHRVRSRMTGAPRRGRPCRRAPVASSTSPPVAKT